jgi:hypothetical protein
MAEVIYALCAAASTACAFLLLNGYHQSRTRLLFWSGVCFTGLALNNLLLLVDVIVQPAADWSLLRSGFALLGMMMLLFGLIWERE